MSAGAAAAAAPSVRARAIRVGVTLAVAALGVRYLFLPLHAEMSLNLVSVVEPYFRASSPLFGFQLLLTLGGRIWLAPFALWLFYRGATALLERFAPAARRRALGLGAAGAPPAPRWPRLRRIGRAYLGLCAAVVIVEALFYAAFVVRAFEEPAGVVAFHRTCGSCHSHVRAFNFNFPESLWVETVDRMQGYAEEAGQPIPDADRDAILRFLVRTRSYSDERLLRSKCFVCHMPFHLSEPPRTTGEWKEVIDRIQRRNPYHISERNADQLLEAIAGRPGWVRPDPPPGSAGAAELDRKLRFERKCGLCHTLDIIFVPEADEEGWKTVLRRMGTKVPSVLDEEEALGFLPLVQEGLESRADFERAYPHSRMREAR